MTHDVAVDTFYAIDFDRCLLDIAKFDTVFYELASEHSRLDVDELRKARNTVEGQGLTFDQIGALSNKLSSSELSDFFEELVKRTLIRDVLSTGAQELMNLLNRDEIPFGIMTCGDARWQTTKLAASGLHNIPVLITNHEHKAKIIAGWQQPDKSFLVPSELSSKKIIAKQIILLDDKAVAFKGLPIEARGYWVQPITGQLLVSQRGEVPSNVRTARGLGDVIKLELLS